ncbi:MAG: hypothetical protein Q9169_008368, partial [Polycauliona sp. 2 TL-2023]
MTLSRAKVAGLIIAISMYRSSAAPATPAKRLNDPDNRTIQHVSNSSLGVDPHLEVWILPKGNTPIDTTSMLVTTVDALTAIGTRDYRARSPPEQMIFSTPASSRVTITVVPTPPLTTIHNYLATFCLYYGVARMVLYNQFVEADFQCLWDKVNVADVMIRKKGPTTNSQLPSTTSDSIDALTAGLKTDFVYMEDARPIDIFSAFITAMNAIVKFSLHGPDGIMAGTISVDPGPQWDTSIVFPNGPQQRPIRRQPPFMKYSYALVSMRYALMFMIRHG